MSVCGFFLAPQNSSLSSDSVTQLTQLVTEQRESEIVWLRSAPEIMAPFGIRKLSTQESVRCGGGLPFYLFFGITSKKGGQRARDKTFVMLTSHSCMVWRFRDLCALAGFML